MNKNRYIRWGLWSLTTASVFGSFVGTSALAAPAGVSVRGSVAVLTTSKQAKSGAVIDYVNARPLAIPTVPASLAEPDRDIMIRALLSPAPRGIPGYSPGRFGDGKQRPVFLGMPASPAPADDEPAPAEFGSSNLPFSTARADAQTGSTNNQYPFRPTGKLFFNVGGSTSTCSASLIRRGIVVTAAHCVADFGQGFYSNFQFVPGFKNGTAPFGTWSAHSVFIKASYLNGTDPCTNPGIVCQNDVAVIRLNPQGNQFPGTNTGFYGFGFDGFGFTPNNLTHITQLGYPACLDNAQRMERNDAQGFVDNSQVNNTVIGSLMCGGSSGGPWLVNFGVRPALTGTPTGSESTPNVVVGVTSWQILPPSPVKRMGSSPFRGGAAGNIVSLVNTVCAGTPAPDPC